MEGRGDQRGMGEWGVGKREKENGEGEGAREVVGGR